jgi:mono/diheme cytochrome c family protein
MLLPLLPMGARAISIGFVTLTLFLRPFLVLAADGPVAPEQGEFFEAQVRPLFAEQCFECHGADKQKAGLRLDSLASILKGGETGPAIIPFQPEKSLLIAAVHHSNLEMPPKGQLTDRQIEILTKWIKMGAPWPIVDPLRARQTASEIAGEFRITEDDRNYWAFRPIGKSGTPVVDRQGWMTNAIDSFVLSKLESRSLEPNSLAHRRHLIRRAFVDLVGFPPTPEEIEAFVADQKSNEAAFERVVDNLLGRPQFGERWGRHWLDVVRFGQTNGYERDSEKEEAWRFRDYVIASFNGDKPFDQFVREQLAGDELDDVTSESIIATGFYRVGTWDDEPAEKLRARYDEYDDIVRTTSAAFLGITVGCARCHDHMFDPISQGDYYGMLAFFRNVKQYGSDRDGNSVTHWNPDPESIYTPLGSPEKLMALAEERRQARERIDQIRKELDGTSGAAVTEAETKKELEEELKKVEIFLKEPPLEQALSVREGGREVEPTHLLIRGNPRKKGRQVQPAVLTVLDPKNAWTDRKPPSPGANVLSEALELFIQPTAGRRRVLAEWIASPDNPLTARVIANRLWQHLFGRGIVRTPNNFGRAGIPPTHPELLDWLASELIENHWELKPLIKTIMMSSTYRLSSSTENPRALQEDPGNDLFWRHELRRLNAEAIRDSILAVSGQLNLDFGGRGFFPQLSKDVLATQSRPGADWGQSNLADRSRRSVYIFLKRTLMVPMLETFDYTHTAESLGKRPVTTVAPQALMLLNDSFIEQQAEAFAERLRRESLTPDPGSLIGRAFQLALGRDPTEREKEIAIQIHRKNGLKSVCLVVLNLSEFLYVD